jgi:uncharacterized membrane protein
VIAVLDALIPPLDPGLGFWLIVAALAGAALSSLLGARPAARVTLPDEMADAHGDWPHREALKEDRSNG